MPDGEKKDLLDEFAREFAEEDTRIFGQPSPFTPEEEALLSRWPQPTGAPPTYKPTPTPEFLRRYEEPPEPEKPPEAILPPPPERQRTWSELPKQVRETIEEGIKEEAEKAKRGEPAIPPGRIIAMGAYEERDSYEVPPEILNKYFPAGVGERTALGERIIGEWVMPIAALWWIPMARAGWQAVAPMIAKGGLPKVAGIAARVGLAPLVAAEKILGIPFRAVARIIKPKVPKVKPTVEPPPAKMPTIQELIDANYNPNVMVRVGEKLTGEREVIAAMAKRLAPERAAIIEERVTKIPAILGSLKKSLFPMQAAKTDAEKAVIAWMGQRDIAPSLARIELDAIYAVDRPFIVDATTGLVRNVIAKSPKHKPYIGAIAEFPDRYILNEAQKAELDLLDKALVEQLERELAIGVDVRVLRLKPGQRYFPRFVKEIQDLETQAIKEVRRGVSTRPGVRPSSFRERYYEEILDGIVKGKRYSTDYRAAVEMRLTAGNKAISDTMLKDYLEPLGKLPKERITFELAVAKEEIVNKRVALRQISEVIETINAKRSVDWFRWKGIKRWYPEQYAELRTIAKTGRVIPQSLKKFIVEAKTTLREAAKGVTAKYKVELRRARKPILGREGSINHAGLQGRLFPIEVSEPTNALIRGEITPHHVLSQLAKVNAVARMGQTAIDTGFVFIQGLLTLINHPRAWGQAFVQCLKTLGNPKYTTRWSAIPAHKTTRIKIATHGGAPFGGTEFTEAARAGGWLEKFPIVGRAFRRFGRVFEDYIDTARILIMEAKEPHYVRKLGRELTERELTDLVVTTDHMIGIGSMRRLGISSFIRNLGSNTLYAPRYYLAFVSFLGRAFQGGIGGDMARQSLAKFLIAIPSFMAGLAYALGQEKRVIPTKDKPIPAMFDPRTGEFMSVEIAGTHMGLGGVWVAGTRLIGSLMRTALDDPENFVSLDPHENPILRYGYGRASPVAGGAIDVATGKNYLGERLDTPLDYLTEVIQSTFPFWAGDQMADLLQRRGVPKAGWQKGVAEWWGLRSWMVQYREQAQRYAEDHIKDIPPEMIMPWQQAKIAEDRPLTYEDLNNEQRAWLLLTFEDYREVEEKRRERKAETGTDFEVADIKVREILDTAYQTDLEEIADSALTKGTSVADYQTQSEYLRRIRSGEYQYRATMRQFIDEERWEDIERWIEENKKPEDVAYDRYMELRGNPPKKFGKPDWTAWKGQIDAYLNSLDPMVGAYIERRQDDWINNLPPKAQSVERLILECETVLDAYYSLPVGTARMTWRANYPDVDARLLLLGRVTSLQTAEAANLAREIADKYTISPLPSSVAQAIGTILGKPPAEREKEPVSPFTPEEEELLKRWPR